VSRLGVVVSGGGARGAYEAGVLSYIFGDLCRSRGECPRIDVVSGTSVGAVNGTFLASVLDDLATGVVELEELWSRLELASVLSFGFRQVTGLHRVFLGGKRATGIFDASPLATLVGEGVHWRRLARNLRKGVLDALIISATNVPTGRSVIFVDAAPGIAPPPVFTSHATVRRCRIRPSHVLASAAIPLVFPPVQIGEQLHCDGGLRLNTPMSPAIHMGMDRLLVIGVSDPGYHGGTDQVLPDDRYPGAPFLLGKVLNAFLLDHLNSDLEELDRINGLLRDGVRHYDGYLDRINDEARKRGEPEKRIVDAFPIRPSVDLGTIASEHLRSNRARFGATFGRTFLRLLDVGSNGDADLASYLLFDGTYARELIALGRRDAAEQKDAIEAFLFDRAAGSG